MYFCINTAYGITSLLGIIFFKVTWPLQLRFKNVPFVALLAIIISEFNISHIYIFTKMIIKYSQRH